MVVARREYVRCATECRGHWVGMTWGVYTQCSRRTVFCEAFMMRVGRGEGRAKGESSRVESVDESVADPRGWRLGASTRAVWAMRVAGVITSQDDCPSYSARAWPRRRRGRSESPSRDDSSKRGSESKPLLAVHAAQNSGNKLQASQTRWLVRLALCTHLELLCRRVGDDTTR